MKFTVHATDAGAAGIGLACYERNADKLGALPLWFLVETLGGNKYDVALRSMKSGISIHVRPE